MKTSDFDYHLPPERIAQHPSRKREDARLLVLDRRTGTIEHQVFSDLIEYLRKGDLMVLNNTRVIPARLIGKRIPSGGKVEVLLLKEEEPRVWTALIRPAKRTRPGTEIDFGSDLQTTVIKRKRGGEVLIMFSGSRDVLEIAEKVGLPPLPPYIRRKFHNYPDDLREQDRERYQTVFARKPGAIAAPTAGFHFTDELLSSIAKKGVDISYITLHVGYGTFQPVRTEEVRKHRIHAERYEVDPETANKVNNKKGRLWVIGTTVVRALESAANGQGYLQASSGWTDIFIYPGYRFKLDFKLVTNFHLPRSTLIMLVSALVGRGKVLRAYQEAIRKRYRFYSFGDAMLII